MAKYRVLDNEELGAFEKEFVEFLVINSITADDWVKIKADDQERTQQIISLFSDVIFEKLMRQTQYLISRSKDNIACFHYQASQAVLVGLETSDEDIDLLTISSAEDIPRAGVSIYNSTKTYKKQREVEMFEMLNSGAEISDGKLYKALCLGLA